MLSEEWRDVGVARRTVREEDGIEQLHEPHQLRLSQESCEEGGIFIALAGEHAHYSEEGREVGVSHEPSQSGFRQGVDNRGTDWHGVCGCLLAR